MEGGGYAPCSGVDAIKDGHDERRVVHLQAAVETHDLRDGRDGEEEEREYNRGVPELVPGVLVFEAA